LKTIEKKYRHSEYLVETAWLEQHLEASSLRVFDCTINVSLNPDAVQRQKRPFVYESGIANFDQGHIPHAGYINVASDLSDSSSDLPLMMPSEVHFLEMMRSYGVNDDSHVVLYSTTEPNWATRVWWMLRSSGFNNVSILNGGWEKWRSEKRPVSNKACEYVRGILSLKSRTDSFVDKDQVLNAIGKDDIRIINALPIEMYDGSSEFSFGRKGRIINSVNVPFYSLHDIDTGSYLPADQLQKKFDEVNAEKSKHIIAYCGGGVAASNDAFALALLGYENVSVYDGSMMEWGNDPSLPMEMNNVI